MRTFGVDGCRRRRRAGTRTNSKRASRRVDITPHVTTRTFQGRRLPTRSVQHEQGQKEFQDFLYQYHGGLVNAGGGVGSRQDGLNAKLDRQEAHVKEGASVQGRRRGGGQCHRLAATATTTTTAHDDDDSSVQQRLNQILSLSQSRIILSKRRSHDVMCVFLGM